MKVLARVALGMWIMVLGYWVYLGVTDKVLENDSRIYHIPIAKSVIWGDLWQGESYISPFSYYPGVGETLLSVIIALGLPVNLFNVIGWTILGIAMTGLSRRAGVGMAGAVLSGVSITMLPTVMRLPMTQLIDIWLGIWWIAWLYLAYKPEKTMKYWLSMGLASGLLIGTKVLGGMLFLVGIAFFGKKMAEKAFGKGVSMAILEMMIFGGFWYLRNWIVKGNPFFPLDFLWWKGILEDRLPIVWKFLLHDKGAVGIFLSALGSEFLAGAGLFLASLWVRGRWVALGTMCTILFLVLPGSPTTVVSNCRYLLPAVIPLLIGVWKKAESAGKGRWLGELAVLNAIAVLPQLDYRPKLWVIGIWLWGVAWLVKYRRLPV